MSKLLLTTTTEFQVTLLYYLIRKPAMCCWDFKVKAMINKPFKKWMTRQSSQTNLLSILIRYIINARWWTTLKRILKATMQTSFKQTSRTNCRSTTTCTHWMHNRNNLSQKGHSPFVKPTREQSAICSFLKMTEVFHNFSVHHKTCILWTPISATCPICHRYRVMRCTRGVCLRDSTNSMIFRETCNTIR